VLFNLCEAFMLCYSFISDNYVGVLHLCLRVSYFEEAIGFCNLCMNIFGTVATSSVSSFSRFLDFANDMNQLSETALSIVAPMAPTVPVDDDGANRVVPVLASSDDDATTNFGTAGFDQVIYPLIRSTMNPYRNPNITQFD
jgi:hypothetical protein